ncbi:histamine H2 receptor [Calypte anna]|nr:histamine H2 receptor [Calypte anna]
MLVRAGLLHPYNGTMNQSHNHTSSQKSNLPLQLLAGSFLVILIIITLCGNIIVCLAVTFDRRLRSLTSCMIVSLAITDLLLALLVLPLSAFYELSKEWPFGSTLCNIYTSLDVMLCTASILNLFMISLDRYFAVTTPLRYSQLVTRSRVTVGLVVIWIVSLMVSFLPIHLGWNTNGTAVQNTVPNCSKECILEVNPLYGLVDALLTFYIPLVIMCITYYRIFRIAREQAKRINHTWCCSSNTPMPPMVKEHKATMTLAVVMGAFIVCWFPYFTVFIYRGVWGDSRVKGTPMSVVLWLGYANSALNPILYGTLNRDFRLAYQHLLHCCRTGGPRSSHLPPLQKAQFRGRSCRQEGKPLKLEMRNGKGILLTDGALKSTRAFP